jgi:hypothetical protein
MEPNFIYHYNALQKLESDSNQIEDFIQDIKENMYNVEVNLIIYEVNQESQYKPFLRFIFEKDFMDQLQFPKINPLILLMNQKPFFEYLNDYLFLLIGTENNKMTLNYECKGMLKTEESSVYLFIDITNTNLQLMDVYKSSNLWFTLVDEIMNLKQVCNLKIKEEIIDFFTLNPQFLFLHDEKYNYIEIPMIVYVERPENKLEFTYVFGVSKTESTNKFPIGNYYYFTTFENALNQLSIENTKERKGIIRLAIFNGKMLVRDNSSLTIENEYENWYNHYDSIYLEENALYITHKFEQQISLSFHYIDKTYKGIL